MKPALIPFITVAWLGAIIAPQAMHADEPAIAISIAAPALGPGDADRTIIIDHNSHFHVVLANKSDKEQRIVEDGNSWGDHALSFEITNEAGRKFIVRRGMRAYSKNVLHWWILQPGESLVLDVEILDADWQEGFPHPPRYGDSMTVTMSAVFEVTAGEVPPEAKLWTGRIVSKPEKYVFSSRLSDPSQ